jgi:hypothetical protein
MTLPRVYLPSVNNDDDDRGDDRDDDRDDDRGGEVGGDGARPDRVSRFDVERLFCGELSGNEAARVQRAVDDNPVLRAFLHELRADDAAFFVRQPPAAFVARLARKDGAAGPAPALTLWAKASALVEQLRHRLVAGSIAGIVTAAVAAAIVVTVVQSPSHDDDEGPVRSKGGERQPALSFFVKQGDGARVGTPGEALKAGDHIQLAVTDAAPRALVVVGVDSAGVVTLYAAEQTAATEKGSPGPRPLPAALVLDDTVGAERFFVVYGDDVTALQSAARRAATTLATDVVAGHTDLLRTTRLALDDDVPQASVHILKVR